MFDWQTHPSHHHPAQRSLVINLPEPEADVKSSSVELGSWQQWHSSRRHLGDPAWRVLLGLKLWIPRPAGGAVRGRQEAPRGGWGVRPGFTMLPWQHWQTHPQEQTAWLHKRDKPVGSSYSWQRVTAVGWREHSHHAAKCPWTRPLNCPQR